MFVWKTTIIASICKLSPILVSINAMLMSEETPKIRFGIVSNERLGELHIIASVFFYAIAFVASREAMIGGSKLGPISFAACRFLVSTVFLYLVKPLASKFMHVEIEREIVESEDNDSQKLYRLLLWGGLCGFANFGASTLAQIGLVTVSAGKAGFITGMYVVFVPVVEYFVPGYGIHVSCTTCC